MKANPKVELCAGAVKKNKNNKIFTYVIMHVYNYTFDHGNEYVIGLDFDIQSYIRSQNHEKRKLVLNGLL